MDLYYQTYKSEEDFFDIEHFIYLAGISYASFLQSEYERSYKQNLAENGIGSAFLNPDWFILEEIEIKPGDNLAPHIAELKHPVFQFNFDTQNNGIKEIMPLNGTCNEFVRIGFDERYKLKLLPPSPEVYWFPMARKIGFAKIYCGLSKAVALYIPSPSCGDTEVPIPDAMEGTILAATLNLMQQAKAGQPVIDTTSDGNPNKEMVTELNNIINKIRQR